MALSYKIIGVPHNIRVRNKIIHLIIIPQPSVFSGNFGILKTNLCGGE